MTTPQPIPVPSVNWTRLLTSRPTPTQYSPKAAAFASFCKTAGSPKTSPTLAAKGKLSQPGKLCGLMII